MRLPIELVLFDLGDTLIYEDGPWDELFQQADRELWRVLHESGVRLDRQGVYGDATSLFDVYYRLHRNDLKEPTSQAVLDQLLQARGVRVEGVTLRAALRAMFAVTQTNWLPEGDAVPTLEALKNCGCRIGLISNASDDDNTQTLIDKAGLRPYLDFITSSAMHGMRKPDPGIFRAALKHFDVRPGRAVMVGDNYDADIRGAHGVGMQGIWITRRVANPVPDPQRCRAEAVVQALSEIPALLGRR